VALTRARIVLAKLGLDGHDRGVRMLARELRDRGCEVILLGTGMNAEMVAATAAHEDADAIGISILSGAHLALVPRLLDALASDSLAIPVVCGGTIPPADADELRRRGVVAVCPVGTSLTEAADALLAARRP
jgi:methylmalonyl-CoA mutase, C-terminal domain